MSTNVLHYHNDGANRQTQATLAFFQHLLGDGVEGSYNEKWHQYDADIKVACWENCREQGYVLSLRTKDYKKQMNIAFFEHRNGAGLCAVQWEEITMNSPTIETANFGGKYQDKNATDFDVKYGEVVKMAKWLHEEFTNFWKQNHSE